MGKRKNQQCKKKNKAGNVSMGPIPEEKNQQKTKNAVILTDKIIHSSSKKNVDVEVLKSNVPQPLDYASVLRKGCKSTNLKSVKLPENIKYKALNEDKLIKNKNNLLHDRIEEELLDFFGTSHISDYNKITYKAINQISKPSEKTIVSDPRNGEKTKSSYGSHSVTLIQDSEGSTVNVPLKVKNLNNEKCILDENTINAISNFQSGYKFSSEKTNMKNQHSKKISNASREIKDGKTGLYAKDYEISHAFKKRTMDITQKKNFTEKSVCVPDKNPLYTASIYRPYYEYSNKEKSLKTGISNKAALAKGNYSNGKDFSSYSEDIKHPKKRTNKAQKMKENLYFSVNAFKRSRENFDERYRYWLSTRRETLEKLKSLVKDLHDNQLAFNKGKRTCREVGYVSRSAKTAPATLGFIASVSAFLSDAASGITSAVQAINIDFYSNKFEEIMNLDSKAVKELYNARSQCVEEYQGIEEITRRYYSPTFSSTVSKISNDLNVKQFWVNVRNAYEDEDISKMLSIVGNFLDSGFQFKALQNIGDSIITYVEENPAALEVCNSACRAARGAFDSLFLDARKTTAMSCAAHLSNQLMINDDIREIENLSSIIDDDSAQSKLEVKIQDAIDSLEFELEQITDAYDKMNMDYEFPVDL